VDDAMEGAVASIGMDSAMAHSMGGASQYSMVNSMSHGEKSEALKPPILKGYDGVVEGGFKPGVSEMTMDRDRDVWGSSGGVGMTAQSASSLTTECLDDLLPADFLPLLPPDSWRRLPAPLVELCENALGELGAVCKGAGLAHILASALKLPCANYIACLQTRNTGTGVIRHRVV